MDVKSSSKIQEVFPLFFSSNQICLNLRKNSILDSKYRICFVSWLIFFRFSSNYHLCNIFAIFKNFFQNYSRFFRDFFCFENVRLNFKVLQNELKKFGWKTFLKDKEFRKLEKIEENWKVFQNREFCFEEKFLEQVFCCVSNIKKRQFLVRNYWTFPEVGKRIESIFKI